MLTRNKIAGVAGSAQLGCYVQFTVPCACLYLCQCMWPVLLVCSSMNCHRRGQRQLLVGWLVLVVALNSNAGQEQVQVLHVCLPRLARASDRLLGGCVPNRQTRAFQPRVAYGGTVVWASSAAWSRPGLAAAARMLQGRYRWPGSVFGAPLGWSSSMLPPPTCLGSLGTG